MAKGKYQYWLTEEGKTLLRGWARDGLTDDMIANRMGITRSTFYVWKDKYQDISDALKKGKEIIDDMVEDAFIKRMLGYDWEETRVEIMPDGSKKGIQTKRHVPGDTTAMIFWLKNRRPEKWRNHPVAAVDSQYEDDGLMQALSRNVKKLFADGDDKDTVIEHE